jgi:exosortase/archaeosortase family protein
VSLTSTSHSRLRPQIASLTGTLPVSKLPLLVLALTLGAIAGDQLVARVLFTSSPLCATGACLLLVWRRRNTVEEALPRRTIDISLIRIGLFVIAHAAIVSLALGLREGLTAAGGTVSGAGWIIAGLKLSVLAPTLVLQPWRNWRSLGRAYAAEGIAGLVVLLTFFPGRIVATAWPWYGQALSKTVFYLSGLFVSGLSYTTALSPTIHGPDLDVTVLLACSGISGIELFDYLFALVAFLDWNKLRKGRTLAAYFGGVGVMIAGNAVRISSFVIFGNRGFAETVSRYHLSAGSFFFSLLFLAYLVLTYRKILASPKDSRTAENLGAKPAPARA